MLHVVAHHQFICYFAAGVTKHKDTGKYEAHLWDNKVIRTGQLVRRHASRAATLLGSCYVLALLSVLIAGDCTGCEGCTLALVPGLSCGAEAFEGDASPRPAAPDIAR